jgi:Trypsin-like peptidase domain
MDNGTNAQTRTCGRNVKLQVMFIRISALALIVFPAIAALLPPRFANAVVALGSMQPRILPGQPCTTEWFTEGTGFLYGYLIKDDPDMAKRKYEVFLVTNRHVIEDHAASLASSRVQQARIDNPNCKPTVGPEDTITMRLNPLNASLQGRQFDIALKDWFFHPNGAIDVAAVRLNAGFLKDEGLLDVFFSNDVMAANKAKLKTMGVSAGDGVFVLGFPMNLGGVQRNYVIVRQGCVARIVDMIDGVSSTYLIDSFIFPGNSGGPVVLRPDLSSIEGTSGQSNAVVIGFVRSYLPYTDLAISQQTRHPRISFEENSGLAEVLPTDFIDEAITAWRGSARPGKP